MPRTSTVVLPGCPPVRAFTADELGFVKVVENHQAQGEPQVVTRWGEPDRKHAVQALSFLAEGHGILAIARKDYRVDILNGATGELDSSFKVDTEVTGSACEEDPRSLSGIALLQANESRGLSILTCTAGGSMSLRILPGGGAVGEADGGATAKTETGVVAEWNVRSSGNGSIACMRTDLSGALCTVGGKGNDVGVWDLEKRTKIFSAKNSRPNFLNIVTQPWVTSLAFLCHDDPCKVVAASGHHQVLLYDTRGQRRPVMKVEFGEAPVKAVAEDGDGVSFYAGNGVGALARFDTRMGGKMVGTFKGASAGSIRSIARHPSLPLLASCGLDRYLRIHDTNTRQLLTKIYLKQQLAAVVFDTREDAIPPAPAKEENGGAGAVPVMEGVEGDVEGKVCDAPANEADDVFFTPPCDADDLAEEDVVERFEEDEAEASHGVNGSNKRKKRVTAKGRDKQSASVKAGREGSRGEKRDKSKNPRVK